MNDLRAFSPAVSLGQPCVVSFDGVEVPAFSGEPLGVALHAAGFRTLARSIKFHRPRGLFCLDGHCASCLMRIDGRPNVRACTAPVRPGLRCESQNAFPSAEMDLLAAADWMFPVKMDHHTLLTSNRGANKLLVSVVRQMGGSGTLPDLPVAALPAARDDLVDVCVVGGGPAGLTAAAQLARRLPWARILLVDDQPEPGGSWLAEPDGHARGNVAADAARVAGVRVLSSARVIGFFPEDPVPSDQRPDVLRGTLAVTTTTGLIRVGARRILYATGGYDQNLAFMDNDRPGVLSARACGRLAFRYGVRPGRRLAIIGPSPYGDRLAAGLAAAGMAAKDLSRISVERERAVAAQGGAAGVRGLIVADADGRERRVAADAIAVAAVPAPASELPRHHGANVTFDAARGGFFVTTDDRFRTTADRVFAAGDVAGYVGPAHAETIGAEAGIAIARTLDQT